MKKYFYFLLIFLVSINFSTAQKVEWVVYGGDSLNQDATKNILIDKQFNSYLCGRVGNYFPADSFQLKGNINTYVKGSFIIKLDSAGNYSKHSNLPFTLTNYRYAEMDDSAFIYVPQGNTSNVRVMIIDTSFSLIYDVDTAFSPYGHIIDYFHLSKSNTVYFDTRYYISTGPTMHEAAVKLLPNKAFQSICSDTIYCTDIFSGDSLGNFYFDEQIHKTDSSIINLPNPIAPLEEFNFNNDGTYSMYGYFYGATTHCAIHQGNGLNYNEYFVSKIDSNGNCMWAKNILIKHSNNPIINSNIWSIKFDEEGNFYASILAEDTVFVDSILIHSDSTLFNNYIIKINKYGTLEWVIPLSHSKGIGTALLTTNIDARENIYVSGVTEPVLNNFPNIYLLNYGNIQAGTTSNTDLFFAKVSPPHSTSATICLGDSFYFGGTFYFAQGIYYDTLHITAGVDSVITLTLFVDSISLVITQSNDTLFAASGATSYQWLNCDSNIIYNNNNPYFIPPYGGNYAAIIHHNNCTDTTSCIYFSPTSINNLFNDDNFIIYSNPFSSEISITIQNQNLKQITFIIKNILGQTVFLNQENNFKNSYTKTIDLSFLSKGIYLLEINIDGERIVKKIVKE